VKEWTDVNGMKDIQIRKGLKGRKMRKKGRI
jgi:hypothetical protein